MKKIGKKLSEILFVALCCVLLFPMTAMAVEPAIMPEKNELFVRFYLDRMNPTPSKPEPIYITIETDDNGHFSFDYPALTILDETEHYYFSGMHIEGVAYISDGSGTVKFDNLGEPVLIKKGYQYGELNVSGLQATLRIDSLVDNDGTFKESQTLTFTFEKGIYNMFREGSKDIMQFTMYYRVESSLREDGYDTVESFKMLPIDFTIAGASDEKNGIIDTHADKDKGETDVSIPEALAIVIIGGAAAMAGAGGSGKNGDDDDGKRRSRYKMCLRKDFGDTIPVGGRVAVYARIVEITPEGEERSRSDLSALIGISSPDYLVVYGQGMSGEYKAAYVEAPDNGAIPATAVVSLRFAGNEGSFTNNVMFQIAEQKIVFGQDNLTLPASYDKTERLPFAVLGMSGDAVVTAAVIREDGYSVEIETGEETGLYYALITEKSKTKGEAGDYDSYTLMVKAQSGEQTVTGELPIYRFHMGLRLDLNSIGCYAEEYDPARHQSNKFLFTVGGKRYVPAESKATLTLFDWDAESHKILQIAPAALDYQIQAVQEADQPMLEKLAVQCQMTDEVSGGRALIFRCCKGALDAPTRFKAKVSLTYKRSKEEVYPVEKEVLLCSQPQRRFNSVDENMAALKSDAKIREWLESVKSNIWEMNFLNNLFPLVKFIDIMLSGYHEAYGFDAGQVETVKQTWSGFLDGSVAGANAETQTVTLGDEMRLFIDSYLQTAESVEKSLGFVGRLAVGVATLGCSEVVFTALETTREMKEYVDKGGDSAWDAFIVGAKVVTKEFLWDYGMDKALGLLKKAIPPSEAKQALREMKDNAVDSVKRFASNITGKQAKAAISDSVKATQKAAAQANLILEGLRKSAKQDDALAAGLKLANEQVENLRVVAWQFEMNPTVANRRLMNEMTLAVQQNKLAMYALQDGSRPELVSVRKSFNDTLDLFYGKADKIAKEKLASITGIPADKIRIMNASTSSRELLKKGEKITFDRDWTAYYTNSKGETVYFNQNLTEQIYNDSFYEASKGFKNKSAEISRSLAQSADQTVIEDIMGHSESYGPDLKKMLDPAQHGIALENPDKTAAAVTHKIKDRFKRSEELFAKAGKVTDSTLRERILAEAAGEKMEGFRMFTKQFERSINPRDVATSIGEEASKITGELRTAVEMCKRQFNNRDIYSLTALEEGLKVLGFTPESIADKLGDTLRRIG